MWTEEASQAILSSLAIHHLDRREKQELYQDLFGMLRQGGALIVADVTLPAGEMGLKAAAERWDEVVQKQAVEIDGHDAGYQHFKKQHWNLFRYPDPMDKPSGIYEQLQWLNEAGFKEVDIYWLLAGHAIYGGLKK